MIDAPAATRIRPKDRDAVLQSLRAGVVPRSGLQHIAVGRPDEINSLIRDIARIARRRIRVPIRHRRLRLGQDLLPPTDPLDRAAAQSAHRARRPRARTVGCRPPAARPAACSPS